MSPEIARHTVGIAVLTAIVVVTGTVVTGAGPHAGDEDVRRFDVAIPAVARLHGIAVMVTIVAMLALTWRLRRRPAERSQVAESTSAWIFIALLQGAVGYVQYFSDVPALLVGIHVLGATALWTMTVSLVMRTRPLRRLAGRPASATDPGMQALHQPAGA